MFSIVIFVAFAAGFTVHAIWFTTAADPLSASEARLVGTWRQYATDGSVQLDDITFLPNREMLIGHGGMAARWAIQDENLVVRSYHCDETNWGSMHQGNDDVFKISFSSSPDRITVDGGVHARASLTRKR
ncbi:MAG: hypothetical protein ACO1RT_12265 [Planctomycetaceae bacterium]